MIELAMRWSASLLGNFDIETAEYYGYDDELWDLDFKKKEDAIYAIKKWVKPEIDDEKVRLPYRYFYAKEGLRYLITKGKSLNSRNDLPGFTGIIASSSIETYIFYEKQFYIWLWETLFEEPFTPADLSQYKIRIDKSFKDNPNNPELWGEPVYMSEEEIDKTPFFF